MKRILLGSTALAGAAVVAGAAQASDGVKLDVGGFFQTVYEGVFDKKSGGHFGNHRNLDRFEHNAEVWFKGETTLDNGLTVGARVELEAENANDQIDKSFVYWSGGFGKVQIGSQDGPIGGYCILPPGATANFSAFSPNAWGSNDPVGSNAACIDVLGNSQSILYATPNFSGFQLRLGYTPSNNAEDYTQTGVNGSGTPSNPDGTAHHSFAAYATYSYAGDGWGVDWGGGGSWQGKFNDTEGGNDGESQAYQTGLNLTFGNFGVGGVMEYFNTGGDDNNAWVAGGGLSYGVDAWTVGLQGSHGHYDGTGPALSFATNPGGSRNLNRVILTGNYALGPGVDLDAELGYVWFHDTGDGVDSDQDKYSAVSVAVGSKLTF
ncbi:porin [Dongia sedimenti]|uniref:Porin n=1 Tax=Dongia sedimenti TaxID=3064282 RepID=A0ABU0YN03_9PROT|nr:porin [Rhodospirillaceae bacterium R-7]